MKLVFDRDFLEKYKNNSFGFDETIQKYPEKFYKFRAFNKKI